MERYLCLKETFDRIRTEQVVNKFGKNALTEIDRQVGDCIFNTATLALDDVQSNQKDIAIRFISIGAGLGKTTSMAAFIAACVKTARWQGNEFSCAVIVPTARLGEEVQTQVELLLGKKSTFLWTNYHQESLSPEKQDEAEAAVGHKITRTTDRGDLPFEPIVIVTHALWREEMRSGRDKGVQNYKGNRRDIVFIDESPDLTRIVGTTATTLERFYERLPVDHAWRPVLKKVVSRMNEASETPSQRYATVRLITQKEAKVFQPIDRKYLKQLLNNENGEEARVQDVDELEEALWFLKAAAKGCVFYSIKHRTFFAFWLDFEPAPGYVLLDATVEVEGLIPLYPNALGTKVPKVRYSHLKVHHLKHPRKWKYMTEVLKQASKAKPYAAWIKRVVLAYSKSGDKVLVIVHKPLLLHHYLPPAEDPKKPLNWNGRKVNIQHWGGGTGENKFRQKTHVFTFGEFKTPQYATISKRHAWGQEALTDELLQQAVGRRQAGDDYAPTGIYRRTFDGQSLRWLKQLALRGIARNVDEVGEAEPMKLYTSMDYNRLMEYYDQLFPGANPPVSVSNLDGVPKDRRKGSTPGPGRGERPGRREALTEVISSMKPGDQISADQIERMAGVKSFLLRREFTSSAVSNAARIHNVSLRKAKDIGKPGRHLYLVKDAA